MLWWHPVENVVDVGHRSSMGSDERQYKYSLDGGKRGRRRYEIIHAPQEYRQYDSNYDCPFRYHPLERQNISKKRELSLSLIINHLHLTFWSSAKASISFNFLFYCLLLLIQTSIILSIWLKLVIDFLILLQADEEWQYSTLSNTGIVISVWNIV